jgi:hypothetical protein
MTLFRSLRRCWPSDDSFFDGEFSALCAIAELSAISICLLEGTLPLLKAVAVG